MDEPTDPAEESGASDAYLDKRSGLQPDQLLAAFVAAIDPDSEGQTVTLQMHGAMVTGDIIHKVRWLKSLLEERPGLRPALDSLVTHWEQYARDAAEVPDDDPEPPYEVMIHMVNARIYGGGLSPMPSSGPGVHWRGRLAAVDGWMLTGFGPIDADEDAQEDES